MTTTISIRPSQASDGPALVRLAALDSAALPAGSLLLGEQDGELRAAVTLDGETVIADPFHPTTDLVALLRLHAERMQPRRRRRLLPLPTWRPAHELAAQR